MVVKCLSMLPSNGRLLYLLGVTVSVLSVRSDVLGRFSKQAIFSLLQRERRRLSGAVLNQSADTERPILPLVEEETSLTSSGCGTHRHADRKEGDRISLL
jgi:hypothetical protein